MRSINWHSNVMEADMTLQEQEAAIAAFIRARGVTRCPTACAGPTQASVAAADRAALRERAERLEATREERHRQAAARAFGIAA
jgi:hypothetical protein